MATKITAPKALWNPFMPDGVTENPFYADLLLAVSRGIFVKISSGVGVLDGLKDYELLTVAKVVGLVDIGATVEGYPVWFAVTPTDPVPEGFPNREHEDGTIRTWAEWNDGAHPATEINGVTYVPGNSWGEELSAVVWRPHIAGGLQVLSLPEFLALPRPVEIE